jgi:hypothetical protein
LLKLDAQAGDDSHSRADVGDTWYRLTSRAKSQIGRALISALVK